MSCLSSPSWHLSGLLSANQLITSWQEAGLTIGTDGRLFVCLCEGLSMSSHRDGAYFASNKHIVQTIRQNWHVIK